jgi:hypothetical protein
MNTHVNHQAVLSQNFELAKRFLEALDLAAERFTFQTFRDAGSGGGRIIHGSIDDVWPELVALNNQGCGVFVAVNKTDFNGRTKRNIVGARALFIDVDHADEPADTNNPTGPTRREKVIDLIRESGIKPSMIVRSSASGLHVYWLIEDLPLAQFTPLQKALAAKFGSDSSVSNLDRVLRLPGLFQSKGEPQLVRLLINGAPRYRLAEAFGLGVVGLRGVRRAWARLIRGSPAA